MAELVKKDIGMPLSGNRRGGDWYASETNAATILQPDMVIVVDQLRS